MRISMTRGDGPSCSAVRAHPDRGGKDSGTGILEIGCGTGRNPAGLARTFPNADITGLDLSAEMLGKASKNTEVLGSQVSLLQHVYDRPVSLEYPFDFLLPNDDESKLRRRTARVRSRLERTRAYRCRRFS